MCRHALGLGELDRWGRVVLVSSAETRQPDFYFEQSSSQAASRQVTPKANPWLFMNWSACRWPRRTKVPLDQERLSLLRALLDLIDRHFRGAGYNDPARRSR